MNVEIKKRSWVELEDFLFENELTLRVVEPFPGRYFAEIVGHVVKIPPALVFRQRTYQSEDAAITSFVDILRGRKIFCPESDEAIHAPHGMAHTRKVNWVQKD